MMKVGGGAIQFAFDPNDFVKIKKLLAALSPQTRGGAAEKGLTNVTLKGEAELKSWALSGGVLNVRTGRFRASIGSVVARVGQEIVGTVGSGVRTGERVPYANIHEYGGVIKPLPSNRSGFLWIPVRAGSGFAVEQGLSNKRVSFSSKVLAVIPVRQVTIPARHYLSKTRDRIDKVALDIMVKAIKDEVAAEK